MQGKRGSAALAVIGFAIALLIIVGGPAQAQIPGDLPGAPPVPGSAATSQGSAALPVAPGQTGIGLAASAPPPVVPANLVVNGGFETGNLSPWTDVINGGSGAITGNPVHTGSFAARVTTNNTTVTASGIGGGGACPGGVRIPVSPSTSYTWTGWIFVPIGTNLAGARVRVGWYAAPNCTGGAQLSASESTVVNTATGTWLPVSGTAVSPATAAFAEIRLLAAPATVGAISVDFDDIVFDQTALVPTATPTLPAPVPSNTPTLPRPLPSNTATPLPTATATRTPTRTITPTNSPTPSWTSTPTPTNTVTQTPTATSTATNTATQTLTATRTATPTNTVTQTSTATNTATRTATATNTATSPATATPTGTPAPPTSTLAPSSTPTCSPSAAYHILIVHSDAAGTPPATLRSQILAEPGVAAVDYFDAGAGTPTLIQLQQYDLVLQYSGTQPLNNPSGLGDVLANYQDGGGIVVAANQDWLNLSGYTLQGRWMTGGYTPFTYPANLLTGLTNLGAYNAAHPLMQGVTTLSAFYRLQVTLSASATGVATYTDSLPLIAVKTTAGHTAVGINAYLGDAAGPNRWSGEFGRVIANAARWLRPAPPCGTVSPTPTATSTATPPRTATGTPPATATATVAPPATATRTATATNTATLTAGPTITPVISPTAGPSGTPLPPTPTPPPAITLTAMPTGMPTNTALPATSTPALPTATPTVCVLPFSDVNPGYWAYGYIKWAYCHGIISGYADGTFRPEADTTRSQIAKMVVLAAGFPLVLPPGAPHFADVPPSNPFYMVVEVAYAHGVISGYADGTFRPYAYVTRAQLARMIVVARGLPLLAPATPTYNDVPAGYWAYAYIETATAHNIVAGYDCGGPGEPCPGRYYRPNTYATRAQLCKMLYQAFGLPTWVVGRP